MKLRTILMIVFAVALMAQPSVAALNAYLWLRGETQGDIRGSVAQPGRENSIMVIAFSHELVSPRDAASGRPTGKRQHKPIKITKEIDRSTPLLMNALTSGENLNGRLEFWQPSPSGTEVQFYSIELINAQIVSIKQEMLNNKYPENMQHKEREHIAFTYETVVKTIEDGAISAEADWAYDAAVEFVSDLNGDGFVNFRDMAIMAAQWASEI